VSKRKALALGLVLAAIVTTAVVRAETIAITGGTVHTLGPQGSISGASVLIQGGQISAVGKNVVIPAGATRIDASGKVVTPGFFDSYSYIGVEEISLVEETVDNAYKGERYSAAFNVRDAINPHSTLIPINRTEGVTRAMVAPMTPYGLEQGHVIRGLGASITLKTDRTALDNSRAALFVQLGETGAKLTGGSRAAATLALREALDDAMDYARNKRAFNAGQRREYSLSRLDLEALGRALRNEIPVVLQVDRASDIQVAIGLGIEFDVRVIILGGAEAWMVADELATAGVPVILDPMENLPGRFESLGATLENAGRLNTAGVAIAFATSNSHNARNLKQAAGNAVSYGLPFIEALRALTVNPAAMYGIADSYGTLEVGKAADVVVWSGDPLEVTTFADHVFVAGEAVPMESRSTKLRDRYFDLDDELPPAYRNR